ncbi:MAG: alpha-amylase family glycosyl hydrolase, partial [Thermoanaerobaculia bacterium]
PGDGAPAPLPEVPASWAPAWSPTARYPAEAPWMAEVVMVAKQIQVWLDQLSRSCGRRLRRLDEVPEEELDRLARWGFNTLWLVGIWQRSRASRWIKQLGGNPQAAASAYAVAAYRVAEELGGEAALAVLRERAAARGLRLAADLVPNHMGVDSAWVLEHPERFLALRDPPYPSYSFRGPDLSPDPRVGLYLEEHYYDRSDAAVVFQRVDRRTGEVRYLYHGNDGTGLPWNDTAQLDYLRADVRAAVVETIVRVARLFPVLRFDAAMTLARRHYQRLWFPLPGGGGAVPSRVGHGIDAAEFERRFPTEFWRDVVERLVGEAPETLLIAEAFWLMEAYFARDLGLHRVYHSAFVNHLRSGQPAALRRHLAELLTLDPRLLAHQVNYLSNPDEAPARELFGDGERYFGACTLLATLPGLPMFAHGQVEGLRERYGMEYRRAYLDETGDPELIAGHERRIAPLLARRRIFAGVERFRLYGLAARGAAVDQVLVFSNGEGADLHLVASNLGPAAARGALERSTPFRPAEGAPPITTQLRDLLPPGGGAVVALEARDLATGERLTWPGPLSSGLTLELAPWQTRVLADFAWVEPPAKGPERAARRGWWRRLLELLRRFWRRLRAGP